MAVSTWSTIKTEAGNLLVVNVTGDIEADEHVELWNDLCDTLNDTRFAPVGDTATQTLGSGSSGNSDIETTSHADDINGANIKLTSFVVADDNEAAVIFHQGDSIHTMNDCQVRWSPMGILVESGATVEIENCHIFQNQTFGVYVQRGGKLTLHRCVIEGNGEGIDETVTAQVYVEPGGECRITNSMLHGDGTVMFAGAGSCYRCIIRGNWIQGGAGNWQFERCSFSWPRAGDDQVSDFISYDDVDYNSSNNVGFFDTVANSSSGWPSSARIVYAYQKKRLAVPNTADAANFEGGYGAMVLWDTADITATSWAVGVTYIQDDVVVDSGGSFWRCTTAGGIASAGDDSSLGTGSDTSNTWTAYTASWDNLIARYHYEDHDGSPYGSSTVGVCISAENTPPDVWHVPPQYPGDTPRIYNQSNND